METDITKLNYENCALYLKMNKYLSEKRLKRSEFLRVCDDIVLMLLDAQERKESAENLFPQGYEKFLDDVAENCAKEKWYETLLGILLCTVAVFSAVIFIEVLFIQIMANEGEWVRGVTARMQISGLIGAFLAAGVGMGVSVLSAKFAFKRFIYNKKPGFYFYALLLIVAAVVLEILLAAVIKESYVEINWVALGCSTAGAAVVFGIVRYILAKL